VRVAAEESSNCCLDGPSQIVHRKCKRPFRGTFEQLVVPAACVDAVMRYYHDDATGGHMSFVKTFERIGALYWWPRMFSEVKNWCLSCPHCQQREDGAKKYRAPLQPIEFGGPMESISWDLVTK